MNDNSAQDPLSALENVLSDAKQPPAGDLSDQAAKDGQQAEKAAAEKQRIKQMEQEQQVKDDAALKQQLNEMRQAAAESPQEKIKEQQEQQQAETKAKQTASQEGHEIRQLDHAKIPNNS
jgi:hypothetical protein